MAVSVQLSKLNAIELDRIIEMAWEDRTPFEAILFQFDLAEKDVISLMRRELKSSSFKNWRKRVNSGVSQKHLNKNLKENKLKLIILSQNKSYDTHNVYYNSDIYLYARNMIL